MSYRDTTQAALERAAALERRLADLETRSEAERRELERERDAAVEELARLRAAKDDETASGVRVDRRAPDRAEPLEVPAQPTLSSESKPEPSRGLLASCLLGAVLMAGIWLSTFLLTAWIGVLGWLVAFFSLVGWALLSYRFFGEETGGLVAVAFVATLPMVNSASLLYEGFSEAPVVELSRAAGYRGRSRIALPHTRVAADRVVPGSWVADEARVYAKLAPIEPLRGRTAGPILAWAVCTARRPAQLEACTAEWRKPHQRGYVQNGSSGLGRILQSEAKRIPSHPQALLLQWLDTRSSLQTRRSFVFGWLALCLLGWALWYAAKRRR